jgi:C-terminal processing protease CtpA/Prc
MVKKEILYLKLQVSNTFLLILYLCKTTNNMKRFVAYLYLFFLSVTNIFAQNTSPYHPENVFSPTQISKDAALLQTILYQFHPSIFRYTPKDSVAIAFDKLKNNSNFLNERQFRTLLREAVAKVRCGHTNIIASQSFVRYYQKYEPSFLPLEICYENNKALITNNLSNDLSIEIGDELLEVNKVSVKQLADTIMVIESSDGFNTSSKLQTLNNAFRYFCSLLLGVHEEFLVKIRGKNGVIRLMCIGEKTATLPKLLTDTTSQQATEKVAEKERNIEQEKEEKKQLKAQKAEQKAEKMRWLFWQNSRRFKIDTTSKSLAVLRLEEFEGQGHKRFYKKVFEVLAQNKVQNLVIDLRNNGGGKITEVGTLLSYLIPKTFYYHFQKQDKPLTFKPYMESGKFWVNFAPMLFGIFATQKKQADTVVYSIAYKPQKQYFFHGKVFLLTNGGTFSAAAYLASYLKHLTAATVIGEESGGSLAGTNAMLFVFIKLPETKVYVRFPLYRVNYDLNVKDDGLGIKPNFPISYTFLDLQNKQDKEMQKVYELVD